MVTSVVMATTFQLAHCVEEASFAAAGDLASGTRPWAVHQVETTVDFAPRNRVLSWLVGGLNFQIEHHLFPQICHIHYAAIARLVEDTCREFRLKYVAHDTFWSGLRSHFYWLRQMGRPIST
jgi:linoleoyl-CoA desaturase